LDFPVLDEGPDNGNRIQLTRERRFKISPNLPTNATDEELLETMLPAIQEMPPDWQCAALGFVRMQHRSGQCLGASLKGTMSSA
jgi:hypothetical protein